jgi:hypothetical protein
MLVSGRFYLPVLNVFRQEVLYEAISGHMNILFKVLFPEQYKLKVDRSSSLFIRRKDIYC